MASSQQMAYTGSSIRDFQVVISGRTRSVIELMVSAERVVLNSRSKYLLISRVLVPRAYMLMIWSAIPSARMVSRFLTVSGLKEPSRSRGVSTVTSPYFVCTVLLILPLRRLPELRSTLLRWASISPSKAAFRIRSSIGAKAPSLPKSASPLRSCWAAFL